MLSLESNSIPDRMRAAISISWGLFARKVGSGLIGINKEASMQLQYAYVLQQFLPLMQFHEKESFHVELETGVKAAGGLREIDLLFVGEDGSGFQHSIAVEMKCYRTKSSSGGNRGATDIFMKDVYFDLYLLEQYLASGHCDAGVSLVMNDMERLVNPKKREAKCWRYDTSQGATFGNETFDTPIGGKEINFHLARNYNFHWKSFGGFWFLEAEGV